MIACAESSAGLVAQTPGLGLAGSSDLVGLPPGQAGGLTPWRTHLDAKVDEAMCGIVHCKLSGTELVQPSEQALVCRIQPRSVKWRLRQLIDAWCPC